MKSASKIICIGAAVQDVYLTGKALTAKRDVRSKATVEQFPLGSKVDIENVYHSTGGGATNAAVTFARQGFNTSFLGKIGNNFDSSRFHSGSTHSKKLGWQKSTES